MLLDFFGASFQGNILAEKRWGKTRASERTINPKGRGTKNPKWQETIRERND